MNTKQLLLSIKILFTIISIIILFIPYAEVFSPDETCIDNDCWKSITLLDDLVSMIMYLPYLTLCLIYIWIKKTIWMRATIIIVSTLYLLNLLLSMFIPMQDFSPTYGILFIDLFHFLTIILLVFYRTLNNWIEKTAANTGPVAMAVLFTVFADVGVFTNIY